MTFFCGHDPQCDVLNGEESFRRAIRVKKVHFMNSLSLNFLEGLTDEYNGEGRGLS
jgi:hypothetical protein